LECFPDFAGQAVVGTLADHGVESLLLGHGWFCGGVAPVELIVTHT
jgi:hypothetical protein